MEGTKREGHEGLVGSRKVVAKLPRAWEHYETLVNNLAHVSQRHMVPMKEQILNLVGKITLWLKAI